MSHVTGSYANIPEVFWASGQPEVGCDQATPIDDNGNVEDSCTYIDILGGVEHSWNAGSCFGHDSYGCEVNVGDHIHDISNDNRVQFHCEKENGVYWYTYTDDVYANHFPQPLCYLQPGKTNTPDGHGSFYDCEKFCETHNSKPASVHSQGHMNIIESFLQNDIWLGINTVHEGQLPDSWPYDGTPFDYIRWDVNEGYPNPHPTKTSIKAKGNPANNLFGLWRNAAPDNKDYYCSCFCQKESIPGEPETPEYPSLPINELCEKDWIYMKTTNKCVYHDLQERGWDSAEANCLDKGGHLVSINSPNEEIEIRQILDSFFLDFTSIGMTHRL